VPGKAGIDAPGAMNHVIDRRLKAGKFFGLDMIGEIFSIGLI